MYYYILFIVKYGSENVKVKLLVRRRKREKKIEGIKVF